VVGGRVPAPAFVDASGVGDSVFRIAKNVAATPIATTASAPIHAAAGTPVFVPWAFRSHGLESPCHRCRLRYTRALHQPLHQLHKLRRRHSARLALSLSKGQPRPLHVHKRIGHLRTFFARVINAHGHEKPFSFRHQMRSLFGQPPLQSEIAFESRLGLRRNQRHEQRTFRDLRADLLIPRIATREFVFIKPHHQSGTAQCLRDAPPPRHPAHS